MDKALIALKQKIPYLTEEFIHKASFDGDIDVVGPDIVIVALRLRRRKSNISIGLK